MSADKSPSPSDDPGSSRFRITSSRRDSPGIRLKPSSKDDGESPEKDCPPEGPSDKNVTMPEENTPKDAGSGAQDTPAEKKPTLPKLSDLKGKVPLRPKLQPIPPKKLDPLPKEESEAETVADPSKGGGDKPTEAADTKAPAPSGENKDAVKLPPADDTKSDGEKVDSPKLPPVEKKDAVSDKPSTEADRPKFVDRPASSEPTKPKVAPVAAPPKKEETGEKPESEPSEAPTAAPAAAKPPRPAIARPKVGQSSGPADEEVLEEEFSPAKAPKVTSKVGLAIDIAAAIVGVAVVIFLVLDLLPLVS